MKDSKVRVKERTPFVPSGLVINMFLLVWVFTS